MTNPRPDNFRFVSAAVQLRVPCAFARQRILRRTRRRCLEINHDTPRQKGGR